MAYVDHAFSISDEDDLVGGAVGGPRGAPVKEVAFAAALLAFGALGVVGGCSWLPTRSEGTARTVSLGPRRHPPFLSLLLGYPLLSSRCEQEHLRFPSTVHPCGAWCAWNSHDSGGI